MKRILSKLREVGYIVTLDYGGWSVKELTTGKVVADIYGDTREDKELLLKSVYENLINNLNEEKEG